MVVHLFLNNNKALDFLPINSIKNGGITHGRNLALRHVVSRDQCDAPLYGKPVMNRRYTLLSAHAREVQCCLRRMKNE